MRALIPVLIAAAVLLTGPAAGAPAELPDRPLSLEECIALAHQHSPSLAIARQQVVSASAGLDRTLSSYYPNANFIATQGRTAGSSFVETPAGTVAFTTSGRRREAEVLLSQTIWQTGRGYSVNRARHTLRSALASESASVQDLELSVAQRYYSALAAEELVKVAEANLTAARDHERQVKARVEVGRTAPADIAPAEADVADAEFSLLQAENNADLAKAQLKQAMGLPPAYSLQLSRDSLLPPESPLPDLDQALETALSRRPDLASIRASIAAAEDGLRFSRAMSGPALSLTAQYDRGLQGPQEGTSWAAALSAQVPLFDGGARAADVKTARANLAMARAQAQQLINSIGAEVETALLNAQTARQSIRAAQKSVTAAESQLAAAEGKYRAGVGIFVEILDAQRALVSARTHRVQAAYDYRSALAALRRAMGLPILPPAEESGR